MLYCRYITRTVALPSRSCQSELDIWSRFDTIHAALTQRLDELDQLHDRQHNDAIRPTVRARLRATTRDNIHFAECRYLFIIRAPASHGIVGFVVLGNCCWCCCSGEFWCESFERYEMPVGWCFDCGSAWMMAAVCQSLCNDARILWRAAVVDNGKQKIVAAVRQWQWDVKVSNCSGVSWRRLVWNHGIRFILRMSMNILFSLRFPYYCMLTWSEEVAYSVLIVRFYVIFWDGQLELWNSWLHYRVLWIQRYEFWWNIIGGYTY